MTTHEPEKPEAELENFAGGFIQIRKRNINRWLIPIYVGLFIWAIYYMIKYWGGLGPGLDY